MAKRSIYTTNTRIRSVLRRLFLSSRERAKALKESSYTCKCGKKQSKAKGKEVKVEVHHDDMILNWDELIKAVRKHLLCDSKHLTVLCKDCHKKKHEKDNK